MSCITCLHNSHVNLILGDVVFQYAAPFTFTRTADDQIDFSSTDMSTFAALVYEQTNGPIVVPIETDFCGPQIFDRLQVKISKFLGYTK